MPTVQATDDFNHAIDSGYYTDGFFGAPTAVSSPLYQAQPKSLEIVTTADPTGVRENLSGTPTRGWTGFPFRTSTLTNAKVGNFWTASFGEAGEFWLGSTGLYAVIGGNQTTEIAIATGAWYWVECIYDVSSGTHRMIIKVGESTQEATSTAAATTVESCQLLGQFSPGATFHYGLWKYGSAASNTDWLGEPSAGQTLSPDADIAAGTWTTSPLFSKVNDASDATYITATSA